jgi:hypothetical protein
MLPEETYAKIELPEEFYARECYQKKKEYFLCQKNVTP